MAFNRELSQFAAYLELDAGGKYIGITPAESSTNVGIGITNPDQKLSVVGDANITGVVTATQFYGNLDYSYLLNATAGVRTEFSVVDNGGDGSLSYDNQTGIISYVGPSAAEARAHFSTTSTNLGSLEYNSETGVFAYTGVTTANIRDQFSASSTDFGSLSYNSGTGEFSLSGITTSLIRNQFSGGTGVTITDGEVAIGQAVGTSDAVTFASVNSTGIVTATEFVTGASGEAIGINTNTISGPATITIDPAAVGDNTGTVVIKGDLQVDGTTTTINSTELVVDDKNITLGSGAVNDAAADGGGITVESGDGNKTFQFEATGDNFGSSENMNIASGKVYKINNTEVLSSNTLGSGVVNSSLTSVGTLVNLNVGDVNSTGVVTATSFSGDLTGNVTGDVTGDLTGEVNAAAFDTNPDGVVVTGIATATGGFSGNLTGDVTGNADTATALETARDFEVTGDATAGPVSFDGTANVGLALTLANTAVTPGSYGSSTEIPTFTVDSKGRLTAAGTASVGTALTVAGDSGSELIDLLTETLTIAGGTNLTSSAASDTITINLDDNISLTGVSASGIITATSGFSGNLTGDVTGNADTATTLQTARDFEITGSFVTATAVSFDGSGNVSLAATITADSIELGTYTSGDYVESIADSGSSDIDVSGSGEGAAVTLGLTTTGVAAGSYGSASAIPTFTVDTRGRLTAAGTVNVSTGMTVAGDSGSETINLLTETLTIAGGTNLTSSAASDTVTINLDDNISLVGVNASGIVTAAEFVTGASGAAIGINTNTISGPATITIDPAAVGDNTGLVVIKGDLQIDGTTTTVNSTTVTIDDKNITLASGAANDAAADGGGITVESGDGNKTWNWVDATDSWTSSEHIDAASGKVYKIGGTEVLSSDTLGSGVVNSSLTNVGTLTNLNVSGVTTSTGGFVGDLTGNADTATALETARDFSISGDATAAAVSFDGTANVGLALTLADTAVTPGSYGSASEIPTFTVDSKGRLTAAGTVNVSTGMTVSADSGTETINLLTESLTIAGGTNLTSSAASDTITINLDDNISLTGISASGIVTATSGFVGGLTGDVTGNLNSSGLSTVTNLEIGGYVSAANTTGTNNQIFASTGIGVTWITLEDLLPAARTGLTTTASASQTTFNFDYNVGFLDVFVNGVKLSGSEFTALNGNNIVLNEGAFSGDVLEFVSYATLAAGTGEVNNLNDLTDVTLTTPSSGSLLAYNGLEWIDATDLNVGIITCTSVTASGDISAANVNTTSDRNLKDNIRPVEGAAELVGKLEGVHFTWKSNGQETIGVIAQQIEEHLPQLVQTGDEHKSVNYNGLIGVLIEAVKEQGQMIAALQAEIEELKK